MLPKNLKQLNFKKFITLLSFLISLIITQDLKNKTSKISLMRESENEKAGIKIALKQDLILDFQKKYLPLLLEKIGEINIPDQKIDVDAKISTLHIYLTEIKFNIKNLLSENISVLFNSPNFLQIAANKIKGNGSLRVRFKLGFISETDRVNVDVRELDISVRLALKTIESKKSPGKLIPSAQIENIDIALNFDFDIHGSIIAGIASLVKSKIKSLINDQIQNNLKSTIQSTLNDLITENVNNLPVIIPLNLLDLSVDYSLLANPKIIDNYLILNSKGAIINQKIPETENIPYSLPENLPQYDSQGKLAQVFVSDFSLNTAIRTAFLSNLLKVSIDSSEIPEDSPIQFNTTSLDLLIDGFLDVYGKDKLVRFDCESYENFTSPNLTIKENSIEGNLMAFCGIFVQLNSTNNASKITNYEINKENKGLVNDSKFDNAINFTTLVNFKANADLKEKGNITANIIGLGLSKTDFIYSKIPKADPKRFEELVNFSSRLIVPFLNKKYLDDLTVKIPSVDGIYFDDSKLEIKERFIEVNLTPRVTFGAMKFMKSLGIEKVEENSNLNLEDSSEVIEYINRNKFYAGFDK